MNGKRLLASGVATAIAALGLAATAAPASARPNCDVPNPPPICFPGDPGPTGSDPVGTVKFDQSIGGLFTDQTGAVYVSGTASDADGGVVSVKITVNGAAAATFVTNSWNANWGGAVQIPVGTPTVCATARNNGGGKDVSLGCYVAHSPVGHVDAVTRNGLTNTIAGWVIDPDTTAPVTLRFLNLAASGNTSVYFPANVVRTDVGAAFPAYGSVHGYNVTYTSPAGTCLEVDAVNVATGVDTVVWTNCLT